MLNSMHAGTLSNEYMELLALYMSHYPKRSASITLREWVLRRTLNSVDDSIKMLLEMPHLQDELFRVSEKIYMMACPWKNSQAPKTEGMDTAIEKLMTELRDRFLVWNLSGEDKFDGARLGDQVLDWDLSDGVPGYDTLLRLCKSMRYWLSLDAGELLGASRNAATESSRELVCVLLVNEYEDAARVHNLGLTGRVRGALVYACFHALNHFLAEFSGSETAGQQQPRSVKEWLSKFKEERGIATEVDAAIKALPSLRRLIDVFDDHMREGVKQPKPLVIHKVYVRTEGANEDARVPIFGQQDGRRGCRPVLEVRNQGRVVFSSLAPDQDGRAPEPPEFHDQEDSVFQWQVGRTLLGDITVTLYHVELRQGQEETNLPGLGVAAWTDDSVDKEIIFRYSCNTGFIDTASLGGLVRLHRSDLDILPPQLCSRGQIIPKNLIVDLIFSEASGDDSAEDYDPQLLPDPEQCLEDLAALHAVVVKPDLVEALEAREVHAAVAQVALQRSNNDLEAAYRMHPMFRLEPEDDMEATGARSASKAPQRPQGGETPERAGTSGPASGTHSTRKARLAQFRKSRSTGGGPQGAGDKPTAAAPGGSTPGAPPADSRAAIKPQPADGAVATKPSPQAPGELPSPAGGHPAGGAAPSTTGPPPPPPLPPPPAVGQSAAGGNAPPPPPMALQKRRHAPALKMLHWKKVPPMKVRGTVWEDHHNQKGSNIPALDRKLLAALLCEDPKAEKKKRSRKPAAPKQQRVSLLETKRSQNVGIALAQFRLPQDEIVRAVLEMDMKVLNTDRLLALQMMVPSEDERKTLAAYLKKHKGDASQLGPSEHFLLALARLPFNLRDWLSSLLFREEFKVPRPAPRAPRPAPRAPRPAPRAPRPAPRAPRPAPPHTARAGQVRRQELEDRLRTAREAAAEVLACKALRDVLGLGLTVGNFLNEGHMLGNALGFPPKAAPQHACAAAAEGG
jgi:hypothetical protein